MYKLVLIDSAARDLDSIWDYTQQNYGLRQAKKYTRGINSAINRIAEGKEITKSYYQDIDFPKLARFEHHFIFFVQRAETVFIIAVFHNMMDIVNRLDNRLGEFHKNY